MRFIHHIAFNSDDESRRALASLGIIVRKGFVSFDLDEGDPRWPQIAACVKLYDALDTLRSLPRVIGSVHARGLRDDRLLRPGGAAASGLRHHARQDRAGQEPVWDPATDALRPAYADRIEIALADSAERAVAAIDDGTADLVWPEGGNVPSIPIELFNRFQGDPQRGRAYVNAGGSVRNVIMNVAAPPFDDIHVRKALNLVIDKQHLVDIRGGAVGSQVTGHLLPDNLEDDLLLDYDPYATPGHRGDLAAARAEMAQSRYDTDGDGRCDLPACEHVRAVTRDPYGDVTGAVAGDVLRRFGTAAEVAALAVMLASDECLYMTGSELHVDGGLLAGSAAAPRAR